MRPIKLLSQIPLVAISLMVSLSFIAQAQTASDRSKIYNIKNSLALEGYDPVSYFSNKPDEGNSQFKFIYKGITYFFSSQANLNKFKAAPEKFEPAYGGWCAYAMGESGEKVKVDPETFKILDGKLYLFYNFWGNNTLADWAKNEKVLKSKADQNWRKFMQ